MCELILIWLRGCGWVVNDWFMECGVLSVGGDDRLVLVNCFDDCCRVWVHCRGGGYRDRCDVRVLSYCDPSFFVVLGDYVGCYVG